MKNPKIHMKPLALASLVAAFIPSYVAAGITDGKVTFTTGKQVSAEQVQPLNFGEYLNSNIGSRCILEVTGATDAAFTNVDSKVSIDNDQLSLRGQTDPGTGTYADSSACGTDTGGETLTSAIDKGNANVKPGIFRISGTGNSNVVVRMIADPHNFLSFNPVAYGIPGDTEIATQMPATLLTSHIVKFENNTATADDANKVQLFSEVGAASADGRIEDDVAISSTGYATLVVGGNIDVISEVPEGETQYLTYSVHVVYQ